MKDRTSVQALIECCGNRDRNWCGGCGCGAGWCQPAFEQ